MQNSTHTTRRWVLLAILMVGSLAVGGRLLSVAIFGDARTTTTSTPSPSAVRQIVAFGNVEVEDRVRKMYATVPGAVVSEVLVKEGDSVPANAVLVRLDDTIARKRVDEANAALDEAKAARDNGLSLPEQHRIKIDQAQHAIEAAAAVNKQAQIALDRKKHLMESKTISPDEVALAQEALRETENGLRIRQDDLRQLKLVDPQAALQGLEAKVKQAEAMLEQARAALKQYVLVAPTPGTVLQITVAVGDTTGSASPMPAVQFCPEGPRIVKAEVEQAFAALIAVGQTATIEDDSHAAGKWTGRVKWVADWYGPPRSVLLPDPNQYSDIRTMPCVIELDRGQAPLKINQRVLVTIDVPVK